MLEHDDWMHPLTSPTVYKSQPKPDKEWYIMREAKIICTHYGPAPTEWKIYETFNTKQARDEKYAKLRETSSWSIKKAYSFYGRYQEEQDTNDLLSALLMHSCQESDDDLIKEIYKLINKRRNK